MFKAVGTMEEPIEAMASHENMLFLGVKSKIVVFNLQTDKLDEIKAHKKGVTVLEIALHAGERILLSGSKDRTVRAWDLTKNLSTQTFGAHKEAITALAKDKDRLFTGARDNFIRVFTFDTAECTHQIKTDALPCAIQIATQYNSLFARVQTGAVLNFKLGEKGQFEKKVVFNDNVASMILGDNTLFFGWTDNTIRLFNVETESSMKVLVGHQKNVESMRYMREALFSAAKGEVRVWNVVNGQIRFLATAEECHSADLFCVAESKSGTVIVTVGADRMSIFELGVKDIIKNTKLNNVVEACNKENTPTVDLTRCDLTNFPEYEIDKPQNILSIKLSHNKLQALPPGIKEFKKLRELFVSDNVITRLQPEICQLKYLKKLDLSDNYLIGLPPQLGKLVGLEEFILTDNEITVLPNEIGTLVNLVVLDVSRNRLSSLPPELAQLKKLTTLLLTGNAFSETLDASGAAFSDASSDSSYSQLANLRFLTDDNTVSTPESENPSITPIKRVGPKSNRRLSSNKGHSPSAAKLAGQSLANSVGPSTTPRGTATAPKITTVAPKTPISATGTPDSIAARRVGKSTSLAQTGRGKLSKTDSDNPVGKPSDGVLKATTAGAIHFHVGGRSGAAAHPVAESDAEVIFSKSSARRSVTPADYNPNSQVILSTFNWNQLISLQKLHINDNRLKKVPRLLFDTTTLTDLDISANFIKKVPSNIAQLKSLRLLRMSKNAISSLPAEIIELGKLKHFWLDANRLGELPDNFQALHSLSILHLSSNNLGHLPLDFGRLGNLKEIHLDNNGMMEFPGELTSLQNLRHLNLDSNKLTSLPTELYFMSSLSSLSCKKNNIKRLPYYSMVHVEKLQLDENELVEIKTGITNMKSLTELSLTKNHIADVSPDIGFVSTLVKLDLSNNRLIDLPPTLALLPKLRTLNLTANPGLKFPPQSIANSQNTEAILEHLSTSAFTATKPSFESTIVFVGLEGSGKTSVIQRLKTNKFSKKPKPTRGIVQDELIGKIVVKKDGKKTANKVHFTIWDFSGHDDYFSLHQFFFSERAIYCIVWDLGLDESRSQIDWYLNSIRVHAGQAPVVLVCTHWDSVKDANGVLARLEKKYMNDKYPNLHYIVGVSCVTGQNIDVLMTKLAKLAKSRPYMGEKIPISFLKLGQLVQKERSTMKTPLMELPDFQKMALRCGIDKTTFSAALHFLHQTGVVVNLSTTTYDNFGAVVLDPQWLARTLTLLFVTRKQFIADGLLHHENLSKVWSEVEVPSLFHYGYIAMVHRLELAFEEGATTKKVSRNFYTNISILPTLLPETAPKTKLWVKNYSQPEFVRLYKLGFVPFGLLGKLMARVFRKAKPVIFWRDGFVVEELVEHLLPPKPGEEKPPENVAKVDIVTKNATLRVVVRGNKPVAFMKVITDLIDLLVKRWYYFAKIQQSSYVSYVNTEDSDDDNMYYFPLSHIENELKKGSKTIKYNQIEVELATLLPDIVSRLSLVAADEEF